MAAIDPNAEPEEDAGTTKTSKPRATLKIIREPLYADFDDEFDEDDEDDSDFDEDEMNALLAEEDDDDDDDEDEQTSTGANDPAKSKKARKAAAAEQLRKELMEDMDVDAPNGVAKKGKKGAKAAEEDEDEEDDDDEDDDDMDDDEMIDEPEEFVICTLDPENVSNLVQRFQICHTDSSRSTTSKLLTSPLARMSVSGSRSLVLTPSTSPETTLTSLTLTATSTTPRMKTRTTTPTSTTSALMRTRLMMRTSLMTWPTHVSPRSTMRRRRKPLSSSLPRLTRRARTSVQPRRRLSRSTT